MVLLWPRRWQRVISGFRIHLHDGMLHAGHEHRRSPAVAVARERQVTILPRHPVLDQVNTMPRIKPLVQRSKPWRHRGRRQIEPQEADGDVETTRRGSSDYPRRQRYGD